MRKVIIYTLILTGFIFSANTSVKAAKVCNDSELQKYFDLKPADIASAGDVFTCSEIAYLKYHPTGNLLGETTLSDYFDMYPPELKRSLKHFLSNSNVINMIFKKSKSDVDTIYLVLLQYLRSIGITPDRAQKIIPQFYEATNFWGRVESDVGGGFNYLFDFGMKSLNNIFSGLNDTLFKGDIGSLINSVSKSANLIETDEISGFFTKYFDEPVHFMQYVLRFGVDRVRKNSFHYVAQKGLDFAHDQYDNYTPYNKDFWKRVCTKSDLSKFFPEELPITHRPIAIKGSALVNLFDEEVAEIRKQYDVMSGHYIYDIRVPNYTDYMSVSWDEEKCQLNVLMSIEREFGKCWSCPFFATIIDTISNASNLIYDKVSGPAITVMGILLAFWILYYFYKKYSELDFPQGQNVMRDFYKKLGKATIVASLILATEPRLVFKYLIEPIIDAGLSYSYEILTVDDNLSETIKKCNTKETLEEIEYKINLTKDDYEKPMKLENKSYNKAISFETRENIFCIIKAIHMKNARQLTIGSALIWQSFNDLDCLVNVELPNGEEAGAICIIPKFKWLFTGILIFLIFFHVNLMFPFMIVKNFVYIAVMAMLLPAFAVYWVFEDVDIITKNINLSVSKGLQSVVDSVMGIVATSVILAFSISLLNAFYIVDPTSGTAGNIINKAFSRDDLELLFSVVSFENVGFLQIFFVGLLIMYLLGHIDKFLGEFGFGSIDTSLQSAVSNIISGVIGKVKNTARDKTDKKIKDTFKNRKKKRWKNLYNSRRSQRKGSNNNGP